MFDAKNDIDWTRVVPLENTRWTSKEQQQDVEVLAARAEAYLRRFVWCVGVGNGGGVAPSGRWYGDGVADKVGVFLFEALIDQHRQGLDTWTWLIVGDIPPARISPWYARNPCQAVNCYVGEMDRWVEAVTAGEAVKGFMPVNVEPTREHAEMLRSRLGLIREMLIEPRKYLLEAPVAGDREDPPDVG